MCGKEAETKKLPYWITGVNPVTGMHEPQSLNRVRFGLSTIKIPKREQNRYSN